MGFFLLILAFCNKVQYMSQMKSIKINERILMEMLFASSIKNYLNSCNFIYIVSN